MILYFTFYGFGSVAAQKRFAEIWLAKSINRWLIVELIFTVLVVKIVTVAVVKQGDLKP